MLAHGAALNIFVHKKGKTWPLEFSSDKLAGLEITGVSDGLMVMTLGEDRSMEGVL